MSESAMEATSLIRICTSLRKKKMGRNNKDGGEGIVRSRQDSHHPEGSEK